MTPDERKAVAIGLVRAFDRRGVSAREQERIFAHALHIAEARNLRGRREGDDREEEEV